MQGKLSLCHTLSPISHDVIVASIQVFSPENCQSNFFGIWIGNQVEKYEKKEPYYLLDYESVS